MDNIIKINKELWTIDTKFAVQNKLKEIYLKLSLIIMNTKNNKWKYNLSGVPLPFSKQHKLNSYLKTKIAFHEQKINTLADLKEDIMHTGKKLFSCIKMSETLSKKWKKKVKFSKV